MVGIRLISDALGADVHWASHTRTVIITTPQPILNPARPQGAELEAWFAQQYIIKQNTDFTDPTLFFQYQTPPTEANMTRRWNLYQRLLNQALDGYHSGLRPGHPCRATLREDGPVTFLEFVRWGMGGGFYRDNTVPPRWEENRLQGPFDRCPTTIAN